MVARRETSLPELLDSYTVEGELYEKLADNQVRCLACGHRCLISPGKRGICQVRYNQGGGLRVPYGYVAGAQSDPIEKKPFFHVLPGSNALTFGMLGCDLHCPYCQNWVTSQALRDEAAGIAPHPVSADSLVQAARRANARVVVSSYNEPLITAEWARAVFKSAKESGLLTGLVSNGHATPAALDYLKPYTDCYKVDLKSMRQENYRLLGGQVKAVLQTIEELHRRDFWLEVLTLVVPGFNDSNDELWDIARFIAGLSPNIPWHVTAFHKNYRMTDPDDTTAAQLIRAAEIGVEAGLRFVYAGNRPGEVGNWENTYCPTCQTLLIERYSFAVLSYHLTDAGACPQCGQAIPGLWPQLAQEVNTGGDIFMRRPVRMKI